MITHPDFKFYVDVESLYDHETHELIYTDKFVAITLYECCYAMWDVSSGGNISGGELWKCGDRWKLTQSAIDMILAQ